MPDLCGARQDYYRVTCMRPTGHAGAHFNRDGQVDIGWLQDGPAMSFAPLHPHWVGDHSGCAGRCARVEVSSLDTRTDTQDREVSDGERLTQGQEISDE